MMEELKTMINSAIADEQNDMLRYKKMAEMCTGHMSGILCDIKHDEEQHKKLLMEMLEED